MSWTTQKQTGVTIHTEEGPGRTDRLGCILIESDVTEVMQATRQVADRNPGVLIIDNEITVTIVMTSRTYLTSLMTNCEIYRIVQRYLLVREVD